MRPLQAAARGNATAVVSQFPGPYCEEAPGPGRAGQAADPRREWFCAQIEANKTAMFRLARSILRSDADAEDAVAEAVLRSFVHLDGLRKQASVKSWLMRITANEAYRILYHRRDTIPLEELGREPAAPRRDVENEMGLWEHVKALPDGLRAPVALFYYKELPISEIADILLEVDGKIVGALRQNGKDGPETIDLDDIGISLILPEEWKDKYTVVRDDERGAYNVFCKSVYDYCVSEDLFIEDIPGKFPLMGLLFTVSWADDDDVSWTTAPGYELVHTEGGSYVMTLTSDVEYPSQFVDPETLEPTDRRPDDPDLASIMRDYPNASLEELVAMNRDYLTLYRSIKDIRLVLNGVMARALGSANGQ